MNQQQMSKLKRGDVISYNDVHKGHSGVNAEVLGNNQSFVVVQFEDRYTTTNIRHDDAGWTDFLTKF
jgi:hypothetical protein